MAVTVTDNRTTLDEGDVITNWNIGTVNTTDFAEATGSIALALNIATGQIFFNGTVPNFTTTGNELVYIWSSNTATQNSFDAGASSSHGMWLSDGTNDLVILMAGSDRTTFQHAETQVQFQCFLMDVGDFIDEANTASRVFVSAGTLGGFDETAVTQVGAYYVTTSKALGGGFNAFIDIIRYGGRDDGLQITGGTTGDRGTFDEIAVEDRSKSTIKAHGIIREYTANTFGCQGTLRFGDTGTASTFFEATNQSVTWEDRLVDDDKFALFIDANSSGTNVFNMTGCSLTSARPAVLIDMSTSEINELLLDACTFTNLVNAWTFPTDTNGTTRDHQATGCTWNGQGIINTGTILMDACTFLNATDPLGAIEWDATTDEENQDNLTFVSDGTGHAIHININNASETIFNTDGYGVTGYESGDLGSTGNTVFLVTNPLDGLVTINITNPASGSGNFSFELASGTTSTVDIVQSVTLTLTGIETDSEVRLINLDDVENFNKELAGDEQIVGATTSATIAAAGTGYIATEVVTIVGGTGTATEITVDTVGGGGEIETFTVTTPGAYTANPPTPATTTSSVAGVNATFRLNISGEFEFTYSASFNPNTAIIVFHLDFTEVRIEQPLANASQSIPIQQRGDRVFNNP